MTTKKGFAIPASANGQPPYTLYIVECDDGSFVVPLEPWAWRLLERAYRWNDRVEAVLDGNGVCIAVRILSKVKDQDRVSGRVWSVTTHGIFSSLPAYVIALIGPDKTSASPLVFPLSTPQGLDPRALYLLDVLTAAAAQRACVSLSRTRPIPDVCPPLLPTSPSIDPPIDDLNALTPHTHDDLYRPLHDFTIDDAHNGDRYRPLQFALDDAHNRQLYVRLDDTNTAGSAFAQDYLKTDFTNAQWQNADTHNNGIYVRIDEANLGTFGQTFLKADLSQTDPIYATVSLDTTSAPPPIGLVLLGSLPALQARVAARSIVPGAGTVGRVRISVTAAETTAAGVPVKAYPAFAAPTTFGGGTFRWTVIVWDPAANAPVAAVGAGNQISLSVTGYVT